MSEIIECTAEQPWEGTLQPGQRVRHHGAREVGEQEDGYPGGDLVRYECVHCGTRWKAEIPQ